ncbi:MAG: hypothetical protein V8T90_10515 [Victivallales bacterium]|jgi:hypothetical protein
MNEWITDLLALQDLDLKIRNLNLRIDTIPSEKKRLDSLVKDAVSDVEVAKDGLRRIERAIKENEGEIEKLNEASRKLLTQSAMVKKNNEYQAMMADIEAKKNAVSDIETKILELLDQAESAQQGIAAAEKELAVTQKSVKAEMADLVELKQELEEDIGEKLKLRKAYESKIDTQTLSVYHRLLEGGKGEPVAMINQGVCSFCRLKVPPQTINNAKKGVLTLCDNCSHILYLHS